MNNFGTSLKQLLAIGSTFIMAASSSAVLLAQNVYRQPPQSITSVIDAQPEPSVSFSPDGKWLVQVERSAMPSIAELSRKWYGLAGMRIDPVYNSSFQTGYSRAISIRKTDDVNSLVPIALPPEAMIGSLRWSHLSNQFVLSVFTKEGTDLLLIDPNNPQRPQTILRKINPLLTFVEWMPNGQSILVCKIPPKRGSEPVADQVPKGPNIQESLGNKSPTRTFQDLLASDHDEALLEYFTSSLLMLVNTQDLSARTVFGPAMISGMSVAPDGEHLLVDAIQKPFSRLMTLGSFPETTWVVNLKSNKSTEIVAAPLAENIPIEGVPTWRRAVQWRPDHPASLVWVEALDGGDPRNKAEHRDKIMMQAAPFTDPPVELCRTQHRFSRLGWTQAPVKMLCFDFDRDRRWSRGQLYDAADTTQPPRTIFDRSIRDRYNDPGAPVTKLDENGFPRIVQRDQTIWLVGAGASPDGDLPFLDSMNLTSQETKRLWRCEKGFYEEVIRLMVDDQGNPTSFITEHESPKTPPNLRRRDMDGTVVAELTKFADPTPQIRGIQKQLVTYQRPDGVPLSATMYLPANWQPGTRLPLLVWAYPVEFNDASTAGQITTSPSRFVRVAGLSHLALVLEGYAVMDNATMPVIGDPETMNDTFIEQIVYAAQAAIDKAVEMGVADRHRVAVGGHSYGAFMTANLLAHCRLFRAGVARSGAYNRTLTPFGFQSERRPYWEAREVYEKVSPFTWANQIRDPLLLIHGEKDNNPGTFPIQSERLYQAIKGNGGSVRLVMLPEESHGYRARESVLHAHAETLDWLNKYVRDASAADFMTPQETSESQ
jgi:dipeptidyl aminopeptidase/acylaminoacyl peptidase